MPTCCARWAPQTPWHPLSQPCLLTPRVTKLLLHHRQNAEVTKQVTVARQAQGDVEREKKELEDSFQRVSEQAQRKVSRDGGLVATGGRGPPPWGTSASNPSSCLQSQEQAEVLDTLKRELAASRQELQVLQGTLESSTQVRAHGWPPSTLPLPWDGQPGRRGRLSAVTVLGRGITYPGGVTCRWPGNQFPVFPLHV